MPTTELKPLYNLIAAHRTFDQTEASYQFTTLEWLAEARNPLDATCFAPGHIVGSALVIARGTNQVALVFHRRLQRWLQPGGHALPGEWNPADTAAREAEEELAIQIPRHPSTLLDLDIHEIPSTPNQPKHLHFDLRFLFLVSHQQLSASSDAQDAAWFTLDEIRSHQFDIGFQRMISKCVTRGILKQ